MSADKYIALQGSTPADREGNEIENHFTVFSQDESNAFKHGRVFILSHSVANESKTLESMLSPLVAEFAVADTSPIFISSIPSDVMEMCVDFLVEKHRNKNVITERLTLSLIPPEKAVAVLLASSFLDM